MYDGANPRSLAGEEQQASDTTPALSKEELQEQLDGLHAVRELFVYSGWSYLRATAAENMRRIREFLESDLTVDPARLGDWRGQLKVNRWLLDLPDLVDRDIEAVSEMLKAQDKEDAPVG